MRSVWFSCLFWGRHNHARYCHSHFPWIILGIKILLQLRKWVGLRRVSCWMMSLLWKLHELMPWRKVEQSSYLERLMIRFIKSYLWERWSFMCKSQPINKNGSIRLSDATARIQSSGSLVFMHEIQKWRPGETPTCTTQKQAKNFNCWNQGTIQLLLESHWIARKGLCVGFSCGGNKVW